MTEAIALKKAKKHGYSKKFSGAYRNSKLNDLFKGKNRLFYPITVDYSNITHELWVKISMFLHARNYSVDNMKDYIAGIAYKFNPENGTKDLKNPVKIGKLLQKFEPEGMISVTHRENGKKTTKKIPGKPFLHAFKNDPVRAANGNFMVVISRHPYDVAGSSTDRSWTSCMDLGFEKINYTGTRRQEGINKKFVSKDIEEGSLIAYVVTQDEMYKGPNGELKTTLQRPLSRILIKPHSSNNRMVYSIGRMYGNRYPEFYNFVKEWILENLNNDLEYGEKVYKNRSLYWDDDAPVGFDFAAGNPIVEEAINDLLRYNNDKELGNQITFETRGNSYVYVEIHMEFDFGKPVVKPFQELNDVIPNAVGEIYSPLERQLAKTIFSKIHYKSDYYSPRPTITVSDMGETGITLRLEYDFRVYGEEDKYIDDDFIYDSVHEGLSKLKQFNYTELKKDIYKLLASYDWESEERKKEEEINHAIETWKTILDKEAKENSSIRELQKLEVISPEQVIAIPESQRQSFLTYLENMEKSFNILRSLKRSLESNLHWHVKNSEHFRTKMQTVFYNWFKHEFGLDLINYKLNMNSTWNATKVVSLMTSHGKHFQLSESDRSIYKIRSHLNDLIGDLGEIKI